jgi:hypothetical protein
LKSDKNILVSPLDWGLGHASRCVPVIRLLKSQGANVIIGSSGDATTFLQEEFPDLKIIPVSGYNIRYPSHGSMAREMLRQSLSILKAIRHEHQELQKIIKQHQIHAVISDNRFGMWSPDVYSIYISHQLRIKSPGIKIFESILHRVHRRYIKKYDECWIPDLPAMPGLAGELSHPANERNYHYVGPLSRFMPEAENSNEKLYDLMVIISGPEPQRSIFEKMVREQLKTVKLKTIMVLGKPGSEVAIDEVPDGVEVHAHLNSEAMQETMKASRLILCRPGYTSIMDLAILGLQAAFVPTPGQTEQEYLAEMHKKSNQFYAVDQKNFNLNELVRFSTNYKGLKLKSDNNTLADRIKHLLSSI